MNHQIIHIEDGEEDAFVAGGKTSPSSARPAAGQTVILSFQARHAAAAMALEDASSPDWEVPPTIGELAVKLLAEWKLPRIKALAQGRRGQNPAPACTHDPSWEDMDA